jgi:hypothetical protein
MGSRQQCPSNCTVAPDRLTLPHEVSPGNRAEAQGYLGPLVGELPQHSHEYWMQSTPRWFDVLRLRAPLRGDMPDVVAHST